MPMSTTSGKVSRFDFEQHITNLAQKYRVFADSQGAERGIVNPLGVYNPHPGEWQYYWCDTSGPLSKQKIAQRKSQWGMEVVEATPENIRLLRIPAGDVKGRHIYRGELLLCRYPRAAYDAKTAFKELNTLDMIRKVEIESWRSLGSAAREVIEDSDEAKSVDIAEIQARPNKANGRIQRQSIKKAEAAAATLETQIEKGVIGSRSQMELDDTDDEE